MAIRRSNQAGVEGSLCARLLRLACLTAAMVAGSASANGGMRDAVTHDYGRDTVTILYPGDQSTVFDDDGRIGVQVVVSPLVELARDDRVELFLNGQRVRGRGKQAFVLADVHSGPQHLRARIVSADGKTIGHSEPVRFYVWKTEPRQQH